MIDLKNAALSRGSKVLLENANLRVHAKDKIALIGANGAGKSTLFQLLLNKVALDAGDLNVPEKWEIAHMKQEVEDVARSALDFVLDGDATLRALQQRLSKAEQSQDGELQAKILSEIETIDGFTADNRAQQLLHGLGFGEGDYGRQVTEFSGGWRVRLNLAQALMCRSDLLLLDEPTNHLDIETVNWLAQWLNRYDGTLVLISHDRDFIDAVVHSIASIEHQNLFLYKGNYSAYERQRAERLAQQQAMFEKQQQRKAEIEQFVARFRYKASKAKQAQSRLKELERMEALAPAHVDSPFHFRIDAYEKTSSPLLTLSEAAVGYGDTAILKGIEFSLLPSHRIGLLGGNGQGKSTLIRSLVGEAPLLAGERVEGEHTRIGYFAQHQLENLVPEQSCFEHIRKISPDASEQEVRNFLGGFNFGGDRAFEPIAPFSGGEKTRLALALVVWQKPNLLVLDEPTNHLDLEMRHALTVAIQAFEGAVVLVSHDQHLLKNTVEQYWLVEGGNVSEFAGDLSDYLNTHQRGSEEVLTKRRDDGVDKKVARQQAAAKRAEQAPMRKRVKAIEKLMDQAQKKIDQYEQQMADGSLFSDQPEKAAEVSKAYSDTKEALAELEMEWLELSEQLEA